MADNSKLNEVANNLSVKSLHVLNESSSATLDYSLTDANCATYANFQYELVDVRIHNDSSPTTSETFTITLDANLGTMYDSVIYSIDMSGVSDLLWIPDRHTYFSASDTLSFAWNNSDAVEYGLVIRYRRLG